MIKLTHLKFECCDCRRDSPSFFNLQLMEALRDLQDLYGWTLVERYDEHYVRCSVCTAAIDEAQEETLGPY